MSNDRPSSSTSAAETSNGAPAPYVTHQVTKLDTLAGLAVKYNCSVSDIKRSNGLLSDSAMYAKDTLLIPTKAMPPLGLEYQTWAGMIVTQYGRLPGGLRPNGLSFNGGSRGASPPRQSAAVDQLQRYYGTGDTCSEPEDFKPGSSSSGSERMARLARLGMLDFGKTTSIEIEMTEFEGHSREPPHSPTAGVLQTSEYAGSREGIRFDDRLRRRKATDERWPEAETCSSSSIDAEATIPGSSVPGRNSSNAVRPPVAPRLSTSPGGGGGTMQVPGAGQTSGRRRESLVDRIKRAASQPSLAGLPSALGVPSIVKAAEALVSRSEGSASSSRGAPAAASSNGALDSSLRSDSPGVRELRRTPSSTALSASMPPKKKD